MESPKVAPAPVTHTVTIKPAQGTCAVDPWETKDVGLLEWVKFDNKTAKPIEIKFDSLEPFEVESIPVPQADTVDRQVAKAAKPGTAYLYSVSCCPLAGEARPRIVIRGTQD